MKKASKKIKILVIMPTLNKCGGIESFYFNYYAHFSNEFSIDFIVHESDSEEYRKMIKEKNDNLYIFDKFNLHNFSKLKKRIKNFFKENHDYDIVHCQMANAAFLYNKYAKKYGIKTRIIHSHQCKYADTFSHSIRNIPLIKIGKKYSTQFFSCGKDAGKFMFKNKDFTIINNAIDAERFKYKKEERLEIRNKLHLKDEIIIGNIGRFVLQKNQIFLIDIMKKLIDSSKNYKLLLIGNGELKNSILNSVLESRLNDKVIFVDSTDEIEKYYSAMDIFALPSLYEGLPVVGIEAQYSNLPCLFSKNITQEVKISSNSLFLDLEDTDEWVNTIKGIKIENRSQQIVSDKFDIKIKAKELMDIYIGLVKNNSERSL